MAYIVEKSVSNFGFIGEECVRCGSILEKFHFVNICDNCRDPHYGKAGMEIDKERKKKHDTRKHL